MKKGLMTFKKVMKDRKRKKRVKLKLIHERNKFKARFMWTPLEQDEKQ